MCTVTWSPDGIIAVLLEHRAIRFPFFREQRRDRTSVTNWDRGKTREPSQVALSDRCWNLHCGAHSYRLNVTKIN